MRPDWDDYFAELTIIIAKRSTCLRAQHGAIITRDNRIICTGYNGSPPGTYHCIDHSCWRIDNNIPSGTQYEKCRSIHAEQNALMQAAKFGLSVDETTMYITDVPCEICAKMIHTAGIDRVVIIRDSLRYDPKSLADFVASGGEVTYLGKEK